MNFRGKYSICLVSEGFHSYFGHITKRDRIRQQFSGKKVIVYGAKIFEIYTEIVQEVILFRNGVQG